MATNRNFVQRTILTLKNACSTSRNDFYVAQCLQNVSYSTRGLSYYTRSNISTRKNCIKFHKLINQCETTRMVSSQSADEEVEKFSYLASNWWDTDGDMKALHSMNGIRVPFVRDNLLLQGHGKPLTSKPLTGVSILEVGCGAGVLSEPLSRLGASVVGIDPCEEALAVAKIHRGNDPELSDLQYLDCMLDDIVAVSSLKFDCVVASEVLEHTTDKNQFIKMCTTVLEPNGSLFISTINRTSISNILAIFLAEKLLGIVPQGTHEWSKFVTPDEINETFALNGCHMRKIHGMKYNPFIDKWNWADCKDVNYILHATKDDPKCDEKREETCE